MENITTDDAAAADSVLSGALDVTDSGYINNRQSMKEYFIYGSN